MRKFLSEIITFSVIVGLINLACVPTIHAQIKLQPSAAEQSAKAFQPQQEVSKQELQAFAKAYVGVEKVKKSQQASLKNA